jgi:hypothetical protein
LPLQVAASKGAHVAFALDTKGPEIRTAMLKGGKDIMLKTGGWTFFGFCYFFRIHFEVFVSRNYILEISQMFVYRFI